MNPAFRPAPVGAVAPPLALVFSPSQSRRAVAITRAILDELPPLQTADCTIELWDGTLYPDARERACKLILRHPGSMRAMFQAQTALALAQSHVLGLWEIEGEWQALFDLSEQMAKLQHSPLKKARLAFLLLQLPWPRTPKPQGWREPAHLHGKPHSIERDKAAVEYHYNAGNEFYAQFLDATMTYSCAEFEGADDSLEAAQRRKYESICQTLKLKRGQRLLDVGCGWGGLAMYAAKNYGVEVVGITLSVPQAQEANRRIREARLEKQCSVLVSDYRELCEKATFDAIASVEMFEHVGSEMLTTYFSQAHALLKPGGLFLNQGTTVENSNSCKRFPEFIKQYVFPDGEVVPIHISIKASEDAGLEVLRVESMRENYVQTCAHWVKNLEARRQEIIEIAGEPTWRIWRLYTAASGHGFRVARLNCFRTLMRKL